MSAPFAGPPTYPFDSLRLAQVGDGRRPPATNIDDELAALAHPRKYYMRYYATREANENMLHAPQGLHDFLRAYFHYKSADWKGNRPFPLNARTADELAKLPTYYTMDLDKGMAETVQPEMPTPAQVEACKWLTEAELGVYSFEYGRTGFQGALQAYRCMLDPRQIADLRLFSGRTIDVPSTFIAGKSDWGVYQTPGAFETMKKKACTRMLATHIVEGAGHWVQQEQPERVVEILLSFLAGQPKSQADGGPG
jgi:pimeloyl-ACP methyl ester carboxylesterase